MLTATPRDQIFNFLKTIIILSNFILEFNTFIKLFSIFFRYFRSFVFDDELLIEIIVLWCIKAFFYLSLDALSVDIMRSARLSLTGRAPNFHRLFPRLAMSCGFLRQLQSCGAHVQSTLRSSSFVSLNSLLLPSLGATYLIVFTSISPRRLHLRVLGSWGLF